MMIPFLVNLLWTIGVIGALALSEGENSIEAAFKAGGPGHGSSGKDGFFQTGGFCWDDFFNYGYFYFFLQPLELV